MCWVIQVMNNCINQSTYWYISYSQTTRGKPAVKKDGRYYKFEANENFHMEHFDRFIRKLSKRAIKLQAGQRTAPNHHVEKDRENCKTWSQFNQEKHVEVQNTLKEAAQKQKSRSRNTWCRKNERCQRTFIMLEPRMWDPRNKALSEKLRNIWQKTQRVLWWKIIARQRECNASEYRRV